MDRRALATLSHYCGDGKVHSLICFVCAQIEVDVTGSIKSTQECMLSGRPLWQSRWYPQSSELPTRIRYYSVRQSLLAWYHVSKSSFLDNMSLERYRDRYCKNRNVVCPDLELDSGCWEWKRRLDLKSVKDTHVCLLCCPEDVRRCNCQHDVYTLCEECMVPLCTNCFRGMPRLRGVSTYLPMALGNDMFWGYPTDLLVKYRVRWIELASVLPLWTHMLVYYVEGHEGNMMNEVVGLSLIHI